MQREDLRQIQQQRQMQTDKRRNMNAAGDGGGYDQYERPPPVSVFIALNCGLK